MQIIHGLSVGQIEVVVGGIHPVQKRRLRTLAGLLRYPGVHAVHAGRVCHIVPPGGWEMLLLITSSSAAIWICSMLRTCSGTGVLR